MLDKVLETCNYVVENAEHVTINEKEINKILSELNTTKMKHWLSSTPFNILDYSVEKLINFFVIYDAIDYSFWGEPKWTIKHEQGKLDGAIALMYCLLKLMKKYPHFNFGTISFHEFENSLKGNIDIPYLKERYETAKEISTIINQKMNGNFYQFIKGISKDTELFELIIDNFPTFTDTRTYQESEVYFYKLAQLLTSDILHIREMKEHIKIDCSHLVGCADYKIPQVLRGIHILQYDEELSTLVDTKQEIKENSEYEVEIRAAMIVALSKIKKRANIKVTSIEINDFIWLLGQDKSRRLKPYHRTRTRNY